MDDKLCLTSDEVNEARARRAQLPKSGSHANQMLLALELARVDM
jgi:hypothetical protein